MSEILSQSIRNTKEYSDVCDMCKDEILIQPIISGRTEYTQYEVEQITLKRIIDKLKRKEQECEEHRSNAESYCKSYQYSCVVNGKITNKELKYKQALDEIAAHYQKVIKNITTYDNSYDASISIEALHNISGIINKAKEQE